MSRTAFSLVELSIVLVILGLLTGGILAGQSLIRASELRSVSTQSNNFQTAIYTFRDKYFQLPGDFNKATSFWGDQATGTASCADAAIPNGTPGTCNGNANGAIEMYAEAYRSWQQLALSGLIEGSYNGYTPAPSDNTVPPTASEAPRGKLSSSHWLLAQFSQRQAINYEVGFSDLPDVRNNYLLITGDAPAFWSGGTLMKPDEAWNIDTKMDDGKPGMGKVRGDTNCCTGFTSTSDYAVDGLGSPCRNLGFKLN